MSKEIRSYSANETSGSSSFASSISGSVVAKRPPPGNQYFRRVGVNKSGSGRLLRRPVEQSQEQTKPQRKKFEFNTFNNPLTQYNHMPKVKQPTAPVDMPGLNRSRGRNFSFKGDRTNAAPGAAVMKATVAAPTDRDVQSPSRDAIVKKEYDDTGSQSLRSLTRQPSFKSLGSMTGKGEVDRSIDESDRLNLSEVNAVLGCVGVMVDSDAVFGCNGNKSGTHNHARILTAHTVESDMFEESHQSQDFKDMEYDFELRDGDADEDHDNELAAIADGATGAESESISLADASLVADRDAEAEIDSFKCDPFQCNISDLKAVLSDENELKCIKESKSSIHYTTIDPEKISFSGSGAGRVSSKSTEFHSVTMAEMDDVHQAESEKQKRKANKNVKVESEEQKSISKSLTVHEVATVKDPSNSGSNSGSAATGATDPASTLEHLKKNLFARTTDSALRNTQDLRGTSGSVKNQLPILRSPVFGDTPADEDVLKANMKSK